MNDSDKQELQTKGLFPMDDEVTEGKRYRELWITRDKDSIDPDKLTHIALFKYYADKNPLHVVDIAALKAAEAETEEYGQRIQERNEEIFGMSKRLREQSALLDSQVSTSQNLTKLLDKAVATLELIRDYDCGDCNVAARQALEEIKAARNG